MDEVPKFLSVAGVAELFGVSTMTIYRAIDGDEFPAVRIRRRLFVPMQAITEMTQKALAQNGVVNAADWVATAA